MVQLKLSPARAAFASLFQPSVDNKMSEAATGAIPGLANLGNTCFMNAVLQCLVNTPGWLAEACRAFKSVELEGSEITSKAVLGRGFAEFVQEYNSTEDKPLAKSNRALKNMKSAIATLDKQYAGCEQQDAYEFLGCLLEGLEENFKVLYRSQSDTQTSLAAGVIHAICGVSSHTTRTCHACSGCFEVDQVTDTALRVPLLSTAAQMDATTRAKEELNPISLEELIKSAQEPELIEGYDCDLCRECAAESGTEHVRSSITQQAGIVGSTRDILVVVLYRFCHVLDDSGRSQTMKVRRNVACPVRLSMQGGDYNLFGVVSHVGSSLTAGHYIAAVQSSRDGMWYECDDQNVKPLTIKALYDGRSVSATRAGADPYILFYHRSSKTSLGEEGGATMDACGANLACALAPELTEQRAAGIFKIGDRVKHYSDRMATVIAMDADGDPEIQFDGGEGEALAVYRSQVTFVQSGGSNSTLKSKIDGINGISLAASVSLLVSVAADADVVEEAAVASPSKAPCDEDSIVVSKDAVDSRETEEAATLPTSTHGAMSQNSFGTTECLSETMPASEFADTQAKHIVNGPVDASHALTSTRCKHTLSSESLETPVGKRFHNSLKSISSRMASLANIGGAAFVPLHNGYDPMRCAF